MNETDRVEIQHQVYAVVYSVILAPGLLGNVLAIWVFRQYIRETKKAVMFMMNLAVADLLQVLSLPLRIYYYLNHKWPFGYALCIISFYLKYFNMYASIYFLVWISVRRCQLIMAPLKFNSSKQKGDLLVCVMGWLLVGLCCLPFPLLRMSDSNTASVDNNACFAELPFRNISSSGVWTVLVSAELFGFIIPLFLVLACTCLTAGSLRKASGEPITDRGEKRRALKMVLSCALVFLFCFLPYHVIMPLHFLVKAKTLEDKKDIIQWCHIITLCLASLNCSLDPLIYYFTSEEFWRRLSKSEISESFTLSRRLSCTNGEELDPGNASPRQGITFFSNDPQN